MDRIFIDCRAHTSHIADFKPSGEPEVSHCANVICGEDKADRTQQCLVGTYEERCRPGNDETVLIEETCGLA